jgi:hypothetical protein
MSPALVIMEGPLAGQRFEVEAELVVGREGEGVKIDDAELSRRHAVLRVLGTGLEIEDLGSLNGTFVNGSRIESPTALSGGDVVKLGTTSFEIEAPAQSSATMVSSAPAAPAQPPPQPRAPEPPPVAPPPAPAPAAAPSAPRADVPAEAFGTYAAGTVGGGRGRIASRRFTPTALSFLAVIATAVALVIYFAQHEPSSDSAGTNPCKLRAC